MDRQVLGSNVHLAGDIKYQLFWYHLKPQDISHHKIYTAVFPQHPGYYVHRTLKTTLFLLANSCQALQLLSPILLFPLHIGSGQANTVHFWEPPMSMSSGIPANKHKGLGRNIRQIWRQHYIEIYALIGVSVFGGPDSITQEIFHQWTA